MDEIEALKRALERERAARREAEALLAQRSYELSRSNELLRAHARASAAAVARSTADFYHDSPVPLFETDFSPAVALADRVRREGPNDPEAWLASHPQEVLDACSLTEVRSANRAALDMFGVPDIDFLRSRMNWFFKEEYIASFAGYVAGVLRSETRYCGGSRLYAVGRRAIDVILHARTAGGAEATHRSVICCVVDVTALEAAKRELAMAKAAAEDANAAKSDFVACVSHDLRTPLNAILGVVQLLEAEPLSEGARDKVALIAAGGRDLAALLDDVLDLSRIEAGRIGFVPAAVDLADFADSVARLWRPMIERKGLALTSSCALAADGWAMIDELRLRQIANNLVSNAVKFTREGAVGLELKLAPAEDGKGRLTLAVRDTGGGVEAHVLGRLWRRYEQGEAGSLRQGGSGLGLSIVKSLAELQGGEAFGRSEPGRGSVFGVSIPCDLTARAPRPARPAPLVSPPGLDKGLVSDRPLRILAAEDNALNQRVLAAILEALGAEADFVNDGAAALEAIKARPYDLVLMDVVMPVLGGVEAAAAIRALPGPAAQTPLIAVTASAAADERQRLIDAGMNDFVAKPIDGAALARAIARWAGRRPAPGTLGV